jgi:ABC-type antimicrobial peptide transport system ATPase subunit
MKNLYDRVIIEFQKDDQAVVSSALSISDLEVLQNMHGQEKLVIIAMIFQEMEEALKERAAQSENNTSVSVRSDES